MMGISPVQYEHLHETWNWYRRDEENTENRFGQILNLQPDIVQLQSWNDAGEVLVYIDPYHMLHLCLVVYLARTLIYRSTRDTQFYRKQLMLSCLLNLHEGHYMGNIWPEALNEAMRRVTDGYDHKFYWAILGPFIRAWKRGDTDTKSMYPEKGNAVQGAFWHHTLIMSGSCTNDPVPKPRDVEIVGEDTVSGVLLVPAGKTDLVGVVNVVVDGQMKELSNTGALAPGFNKFKFGGLVPGKVQVEVWDGRTMVGGGYGPIEVKSEAELCNHQFQVVAVPS
jgi:glucan endo-1,3-alpha-glucosidase